MTERRRRRRRTVLVPVLGLGVAAWAVHRKLSERSSLDEGWQPLPPAPSPVPVAGRTATAPPLPPEQDAVVEPAASAPAEPAQPTAVEPEPSVEPVERPRTRAVAAAAAVATVTAPAAPTLSATPFGPGSLRALDDGSSPDPGYTVKGKSSTKVFHVPGGAYYTRTRADVWFRTARDARGAGFTERTRRPAERT
jgi:hypothetical protein